MNTNEVLKVLGQALTNKLLVDTFLNNNIDVKQSVELEDGEYRAYYEKENDGFSLMFTDEAMFLNKSSQPVGKGPLYFSGILLYAEGKEEFSQYKGALPHGLTFNDDITSIENKLGQSSWQRKRDDGSLIAKRWDLDDFRIHISFFKKNSLPSVFNIHIPDAD